jgi:pyruvate ferredoxin oxidoreductase gamma subunit
METIGIRWHSRAGHGAITAANALCEIIAKNTDLQAQSFPDFGAEKKGAPVTVYNRFSNNSIEETHHVNNPDSVLLLDTSLINIGELSYELIVRGLKDSGSLIINTDQKTTNFSKFFKGNIYHLDASFISEKYIGRNIPNVPMLGALLKVLKLVDFKTFSMDLRTYLLEALPEKIVDANLLALKIGFDEVVLSKK